ncbi:hybrid sensor histidine kinase/response regulator [Luteimonas vadosa]|uniref:histidine kinase n=1 Tax=Luteimonas vadosa TaxID=1165507 RepID=A0ABP9E348_9GAMM
MTNPVPDFMAGGGDMGRRMRELPWEGTALGAPEAWPSALKTLVAIMLASNQPMFTAWGPSRTLLYNDHYAGILGNKHPAALAQDFLEVWYEIRAQLDPIFSAAVAGQPVQMQDIPLVMHRHGYPEQTHFSFFYSPVRGGGGAVDGVFCACTEITAQVLAEQRLAESEARHRGVLANMDEAFLLLDRDFRVLEVNEATLRLAACDREALLDKDLWSLYPEVRDTELGRMYRQVLADGQPGRHEFPQDFADGRSYWLEARAYPVAQGLAVFIRDLSEHRRIAAEAALAAERVQLALDAGAIVGTWVWTIPDNRFIADARFAASFGLDAVQCREGLALEEVMESIHVDDRARVSEAVAEVMARGGAYRCEYRVRHRDGTMRWVEANGRVEMDADGRPIRFPGVLLDIETRRQTEAERDQAAALLRTFIEAVPGVVYAKDAEGRFLVANRGVSELLGLPPEKFLGRTDAEVLADPVQGEAVMATDRRIMASGNAEQIEEEVRLADGTPALWLSTKAPLRDADGKVVGLIGSSVDITDRKQMENALRLSEQRSALALDVAQLGTWNWDPRTGDVQMDARCRQIVGVAPGQEVLGLDVLSQRIHPEDWPRVKHALEGALAPDSDGRYSEEFRWIHADGQVVWTMSRGQVLFDSTGPGRVPATMIGSVLDITERHRMVETLEQADRRKDEFLAMLAHELRNPLAPIGTAAHLLGLATSDEDRVREIGQVITRQVGHMTELVDDLLDVSRVTRGLVELAREPVDIRSVLAAAVEQVEPLVHSRGHALTMECPRSAVVLGDRHRLVQVVSNLLNNAAKYTPQGGRLQLSCERDGEQVVIRVIDSGIGMDEQLVPRVFDLFTQAERTPDRSQGGLGIGLALVRSIVQLHGGSVAAASPGLGRGSTLTVTLPLAPSEQVPSQASCVPRQATAPLKILVVDDNRDAAESLAMLLEVLGHQPRVAVDGRSALELANAEAPWDAFILDIGLPDMTGYELAQALAGTVGRGLFIALTGYGHSHDRTLSKAAGFAHHMVKPVDVPRMQEILGSVESRREPA